jgi:hypothetical protein
MAADSNLPPFPNYFELFQNIANPFVANAASNPAANPAAMMMAGLDPKELERRMNELQTVLAWLKAQVGMVELSLQTLEYQKSFVSQMAAGTDKSTAGETAELVKTAAALNPALWAWNLMQQATEQSPDAPKPTGGARETPPKPKAKRR